jgi:hypothetical protein
MGCPKPVPPEGQAFLVLKFDNVAYMADMQIFFFDSDFKETFSSFKNEYFRESSSAPRGPNSNDNELVRELTEIENKISEIQHRNEKLEYQPEIIKEELIDSLKREIENRASQIFENTPAFEKYEEIASGFNKLIQEHKKSIFSLSKEVTKLQKDAVQKINDCILKNKLKTKVLPKSAWEQIFDWREQDDCTESIFSTVFGEVFIISKTFRRESEIGRRYDFLYLRNIPTSLNDTPVKKIIIPLFNKWKPLDNKKTSLKVMLNSQKYHKKLALIPWENKYAQDPEEFAQLHRKLLDEQKTARQRLSTLEGSGAESQNLLNEELMKMKNEVEGKQQKLSDIRQAKLRKLFYSKFLKLIGENSIATTRTSGEGHFTIPKNARYLFASRTRDTGEHISWLLSTVSDQPTLRLSNSNAITSQDAYDFSWIIRHDLDTT